MVLLICLHVCLLFADLLLCVIFYWSTYNVKKLIACCGVYPI